MALALAGVIAVLGGCGPSEPAPQAEAPEETPPADAVPKAPCVPWYTYHGGPELDGAVDIDLPDGLALLWRFKAEAPVLATPVGGDGRAYFANAKGKIFSVDLDGNEVWSNTFVRPNVPAGLLPGESFDAPLLIVDRLVVAASADGAVYGLDAATGEQRWKSDIDASVLGSPNFTRADDGVRLFVIDQGMGALHCLDAATGASLWKSEDINRCDGSPGVGHGVVVFGSCAEALHFFAIADGTLLRETPMGVDGQVAGGVAVVDGAAYAGTRSGSLVKVDVESGEVLWRCDAGEDEAFTTPAVKDDWVVYGCQDENVRALDRATGEVRWTLEADYPIMSPLIAGDKVLFTADGVLKMVGLADGGELWSFEVGDEATSPAIVDGLVLVGSDDGTVAAFGVNRDGGEDTE